VGVRVRFADLGGDKHHLQREESQKQTDWLEDNHFYYYILTLKLAPNIIFTDLLTRLLTLLLFTKELG